jgi:6-phosphogluconolactonase
MTHTTHIYENADLSARAVADLIREKANTKKQQLQYFSIAVSGGSTPKLLFSLLAEEDYRTQIPWESVLFFWVDERCVEPAHPESNFGMTYDALLQYAFVPAENIFRMKGEDIPDNEAIRYTNLLRNKLPAKDGFPVFDLIILGIGEDGHTASIFPDNLPLLETDKPVEVATHPVSGQKRITLTGKTINNAEEVLFLINGKNKAKIVADIINQQPEAKKYPANYVHNAAGQCLVFLDKDAVNF